MDFLGYRASNWYKSLSDKERIRQVLVYYADVSGSEALFNYADVGAILYPESIDLKLPKHPNDSISPLIMLRSGILFQDYQNTQNIGLLQHIDNANLLFQLGRQKGLYYKSAGLSQLFVTQAKVHPSLLESINPQQRAYYEGLESSEIFFDATGAPSANTLLFPERDLNSDALHRAIQEKDRLLFFKNTQGGFDKLLAARITALQRGADMIWVRRDIERLVEGLHDALKEGTWSRNRMRNSVMKVLKHKLKQMEKGSVKIHPHKLMAVQQTIAEKSLRLIKNKAQVLPFKNLENKRIAYVPFGNESGNTFFEGINQYTQVKKIVRYTEESLKTNLIDRNIVLVGLHQRFSDNGKYFSEAEKSWLYQLSQNKQLVLVLFTNSKVLEELEHPQLIDAVVVGHINHHLVQKVASQALFGGIQLEESIVSGRLPREKENVFGSNNTHLKRLGYAFPESVGMDSYRLLAIDSLMREAIDSLAIPGGQIVVGRKGKIVYEKSFGYHTYEKTFPVRNNNLYDLASLTKILATLPLVMQLEEWGQIDLQQNFGQLLPELQDKEIGKVKLLDALAHYGRMPAWIPFYFKTLDSVGKPSPDYYRRKANSTYNIEVHKNLYMRKDYRDSMYLRIDTTKLKKRLRYRYSDLTYYILKRTVERKYQKRMDLVLEKEFYRPLGMTYTTYNPLRKFNKSLIVPSEKDTYFRHDVLQGYVHDMGAAMLGGVGGHAGLFANANDVAKIMQMYLQKGNYGGKQLLQSSTIDVFNNCYFCKKQVRRGLGFDKPQLGAHGPTCGCASPSSFGHSGFTGTFVWADPEEEIVYVFLSNRTYPSANNKKLQHLDTRAKIQEVIYSAIMN